MTADSLNHCLEIRDHYKLVWSHTKRTGVARNPLRTGEKLEEKVNNQLQALAKNPALVRSFFGHPSVAYISDC
jgi:hypothetical protein